MSEPSAVTGSGATTPASGPVVEPVPEAVVDPVVDPLFGEAPTPAEIPAAEPADRVRAAVLEVPGVAELHAGAFGEVGTYLPGRRVAGVRLRDDGTEVHVVVTMGADVRSVAGAVREAVTLVVPGPVDVTVEDVVPA